MACALGGGLSAVAILASPDFYGEAAYIGGINIGVIGVFAYLILGILKTLAQFFISIWTSFVFFGAIILLIPVTVFLMDRSYSIGRFDLPSVFFWGLNIFLVCDALYYLVKKLTKA